MICFHFFYKISLLQSNKKIKIQREGIQLTVDKPTWKSFTLSKDLTKCYQIKKKFRKRLFSFFICTKCERTYVRGPWKWPYIV